MACIHTYQRGLGVACSDTKAIPEPRNAEQQQCSPAFFVSISIIIYKKLCPTRIRENIMKKNKIKIGLLCLALLPLLTSCGDGGYVVVPIWVVAMILACFCFGRS